MLSQISKLLLPRRKRRSLCQVILSLRRRQFERLETRSMLSANIGAGPRGLSDFAFDRYEYGEPSHGDDGVYAPIPHISSVDGFMPRGDEPHYAHLDAINQFHPAYANIGDGLGAWALEGRFGPPSSNASMSFAASSSKPAVAAWVASPTIVIVYVNNYESYFEIYAMSPPPSRPSIARSTAPPALSSNSPQVPKNSPSSPKSSSDFYAPSGVSVAATAAAIPSAAQIVARYASKSSIVSSAAIDAALQSYSPPRLLVANNSSADRAMTAGENTVVSDGSFDDFIELTESSPIQTIDFGAEQLGIAPDDVVNSILEHLQEFEMEAWHGISPKTQVANDAIDDSSAEDTPAALALAYSVLVNAEGGMVMLEFSDGQPRDFDFSNVADNGVVTPTSHSNLGSAVGFYQAVEVAGEEAAGVIRTTASVPIQNVKQNRTENRLSTQTQPATGEKAAVVAGASALIGAAVWCAQRKQSDEVAASAKSSTRGR